MNINAVSPIFIGGMQRSGTSLMRAIVGSHPDVAMFEWDLPLWTRIYHSFKLQDLDELSVRANLIDTIFANEKVVASVTTVDRYAIEARLTARSQHRITCGLVFQCFLEEYARILGRPRWGLKTPHNEFVAKEIFSAYPDARMVQMIRDPRDVAVSYQSYDGGAWEYSASQHIEKWRESVKAGRENSGCFGGQYLCVRYEDLVTSPEETVRQVCDVLNLEFTAQMLGMTRQLGWTGNNSFFNDVSEFGSKISTSAIGRYRKQLQQPLKYKYQERLSVELRELSYPLENFRNGERIVTNAQWYAYVAYGRVAALVRFCTRKTIRLLYSRCILCRLKGRTHAKYRNWFGRLHR